MKALPLITSLVAATTLATAQGAAEPPQDISYELRGQITFVSDAQGFVLNCTEIPMISDAVLLSDWEGIDARMEVTNVGTANEPLLRVERIGAIDPILEIGQLRLGQRSIWQIHAPGDSFTIAFANFGWHVGFTPLGNECYLLGPNAQPLAAGFTNSLNLFKFSYYVPYMPAFIGVPIVGQAGIVPLQQPFYLSNADCSTITR